MTSLAILVLALAASLYAWYHTLSFTARNDDSPLFAIALGGLVMVGGILLAIAIGN